MKLLALAASTALALAPLSAIAGDDKVNVADKDAAIAAPAPGGVASSSFDVDEEDAELITLGLIAGTGIIAIGTIIAISSGGDDNPATPTPTTGTN